MFGSEKGRLNILIFAGYFIPHVGGYIKNVHELSKRLVQKGYKVTVVTCNTEKVKVFEEIDGIKIIRLPAWNLLNGNFPIPKPSRYLFRLLRTKDNLPDIVITQTRFFVTSFIGYLFARKYKLPLIHVERGSYHSVMSNKLVNFISHYYDHSIGSRIIKYAKYNIGVSKAACDFIEHIGVGVYKEVIYNGIEIYLDYDDTVYDICFVGRLIYAKGVQDLITAFERCYKQRKDIKLSIVGNGDYREKLEEQANATICRNNIIFLGTKEPKEVIRILSKSHIFVNPSYSEGLPTSVMEAASLGKPIIATDVGGTSEIIEHGVSGIIYKPHDIDQLVIELLGIMNDYRKARKLGVTALNKIKDKFSWDKIVEQYEDIFKEVTNKE
jgi:glycosyltransferase involved in cell wall biosynthesis